MGLEIFFSLSSISTTFCFNQRTPRLPSDDEDDEDRDSEGEEQEKKDAEILGLLRLKNAAVRVSFIHLHTLQNFGTPILLGLRGYHFSRQKVFNF